MHVRRAVGVLLLALAPLVAVPAPSAARPRTQQPLYVDPTTGVSVLRPRGWELSTADGTLTLTRGQEQRVGVMILPARVAVDLPAQAWLERFGAAIGEALQGAGGSLALGSAQVEGSRALVAVEGRSEGVDMRGQLEVTVEPGFVTMKLLFAPKAQWAREVAGLTQVGQSFRRATATHVAEPPAAPTAPPAARRGRASSVLPEALVLDRHQGTHFQVALPRGWEVVGETFRGIDLKARDGSGHVSYAFMLNTAAGLTPQGVIAEFLPAAVRDVKVLREIPQPSPGGGWQVLAVEIVGQDVLLGTRVRGVVTSGVVDVLGYATNLQIALRTAPEPLWMARRSLLGTIQDAILLTGGQAPPGYELIQARNNPCDSSSIISAGLYRDQVRSRSSAQWSNAMMGTERVSSPSLGRQLTVPQSSWWGTGPQGPGYYRSLPDNGFEKLEIVR